MRDLGKGCLEEGNSCPINNKDRQIMEMTTEKFIEKQNSMEQVEALKTLTRLMLKEVETLAEIYLPYKNGDEESSNLEEKVQRYEVSLICRALLEARGNQRKAAKILGTKATTLHAKIRRYDIDLFAVFGSVVE
jgi:transcriptional regulator with GAF, ATPase, and Fis domain